jgi:hypothetical protein
MMWVQVLSRGGIADPDRKTVYRSACGGQRRSSCQSYFNRHTIPLGSVKFTDYGAFHSTRPIA